MFSAGFHFLSLNNFAKPRRPKRVKPAARGAGSSQAAIECIFLTFNDLIISLILSSFRFKSIKQESRSAKSSTQKTSLWKENDFLTRRPLASK